jgi:hypothetical protein
MGIDRKLKERRIPLILYTDEKKDYQRALWDKRIGFDSRMFEGLCRHHTTNSQDARNQKNPLFSVNYFDREIRKDMASHSRETVQFPRNVCNAMLRMYLYMFDHNVRKPYRINNRELSQLRHAQVAGADLEYLKSLVGGFLATSGREAIYAIPKKEKSTPVKCGGRETIWWSGEKSGHSGGIRSGSLSDLPTCLKDWTMVTPPLGDRLFRK